MSCPACGADLGLWAPAPIHRDPSPTEVKAAARVHVTEQRVRAIEALFRAGAAGLTHRELDSLMGWPAVTGSRRLYDLHQMGRAVRTTRERQACSVYVHHAYWVADMGWIEARKRA